MPIPKDKRTPTNCSGGWFYVNEGSITTVTEVGSVRQCTVTRAQMNAALKLMRKRPTSKTAAQQ